MEIVLGILRPVLGIGLLLLFCYFLSERKDKIRWSLVAYGLVLQILLAVLMLKLPFAHEAIRSVSQLFNALVVFSNESTAFVFGTLASDSRGTYGFAFTVLPTIIFFSAFSAILYYLRVLPCLVYAFAWMLNRTLRLTGAESLAAAANIFVGQTEAPLVVKPYLKLMNRSEIMAVMTGGMATIAGGVLVAYMAILGGEGEACSIVLGQHLLTASILSAPAAMVASKILIPQTEPVSEKLEYLEVVGSGGILDAITKGTTDGMKLALNVGGMLSAFTALVAVANWVVANGVGKWTGLNDWVCAITDGRFREFNFSFLAGVSCTPFAWVIGVSWGDCLIVGQLLGERLVLNEFISYLNLAKY